MTITETDIQTTAEDRMAGALAEYGVESAWDLPVDVRAELAEATRQDWIRFNQERNESPKVTVAATDGSPTPTTPTRVADKVDYGTEADGTRITATAIRNWAATTGIVVGKRGRLNNKLVEQYKNR